LLAKISANFSLVYIFSFFHLLYSISTPTTNAKKAHKKKLTI